MLAEGGEYVGVVVIYLEALGCGGEHMGRDLEIFGEEAFMGGNV